MVLGIDSISGATRGRYLPSEFWKSPVPASALEVEDAVGLDSVESEQASVLTPELGNSCCADCQSSAQGCGKNFFTNSGGNDRCRGICVTNYSCTYRSGSGVRSAEATMRSTSSGVLSSAGRARRHIASEGSIAQTLLTALAS